MKPSTKVKFHNVRMNVSKQKPLILMVLGISGSLFAVADAFKVAPKAQKILEEVEATKEPDEKKSKTLWRKTKAVAPIVWPIAVMEGTSIICTISSYKISTKRLSALATAYAISERRFADYQEEVVRQFGKNKEKKVHDEVVAKEVANTPVGGGKEVIMLPGKTLCYDAWTGRYFQSDMETIRSIENELNARLMEEMYISLNDLYYELEIPPVEIGEEMGWNVDNKLSFSFSSTIAPNKEPCLILDYDVYPRFDYRRLH